MLQADGCQDSLSIEGVHFLLFNVHYRLQRKVHLSTFLQLLTMNICYPLFELQVISEKVLALFDSMICINQQLMICNETDSNHRL
jgi:hypothetical protein